MFYKINVRNNKAISLLFSKFLGSGLKKVDNKFLRKIDLFMK